MTAVEEPGAGGLGGHLVSLQALRATLRNKSTPWAALGNRKPSLG